MKTIELLKKDGLFLVILRPADPSLALELAEYAMKTQRPEDFQNVLTAQPYAFVGFLGSDQHIYDINLNDLGETQRGDSIVTSDHGYVQGRRMPS